jgi:hypothetical protein
MKRLRVILFFIFGTSLFTLCEAQFNTYHPFASSNAYWREISCQVEEDPCLHLDAPVTFGFDYYVDGDTIVAGKTYFKVRTSGGYEVFSCSVDWYSFDRFFCLIREDTAAKKIWF